MPANGCGIVSKGGRRGRGGSSGGRAVSDAMDEGPERMSPLPLEYTATKEQVTIR